MEEGEYFVECREREGGGKEGVEVGREIVEKRWSILYILYI